jgi:hypothetical protein
MENEAPRFTRFPCRCRRFVRINREEVLIVRLPSASLSFVLFLAHELHFVPHRRYALRVDRLLPESGDKAELHLRFPHVLFPGT